MIVLFTDFGSEGPYIGQMKARILQSAPGATIIDLFSDAPMQDPKACSYLLAAYAAEFPVGAIFLSVVDPGVGGSRAAVAMKADGKWFVGPGNGLFEMAARQANSLSKWEINYSDSDVSASFHGRDLFAPLAARLENGLEFEGEPRPVDWESCAQWPDQLGEVIYLDHYGNAMTGISGGFVNPSFALRVNDVYLRSARTYTDVSEGAAFWYVNSIGLVEIAVNQGSAADLLGLKIGTSINFGNC
ncbi:MAG: SAM-dependent chlorinase/fluorinase [Rhodospirillales bacterium]|nr:SAM-dependent chlorinase/fluorinase [Rhodospirillales bacterium]